MKNKIKKNSKERILKKNRLLYTNSYLNFILSGIACHAMALLDEARILALFSKNKYVYESDISLFKNFNLVKAALTTLVHAKVIRFKKDCYSLTKLGKELVNNIGLVTVPLAGYRKLFAKQYEILSDPSEFHLDDIDFKRVAWASTSFGQYELDPLLFDIIKKIKPKGTICDLGCGSGEKLIKICQEMDLPGLGIELSEELVKNNSKQTKDLSRIEFVQGDIQKLEGVWEDVQLVMSSYVCHDITPNSNFINMLQSFHITFPRMKYLIIVDIVSSSPSSPSIMPGFDYVHGLQGVIPRSYDETVRVFDKAKYHVLHEFSVQSMPNAFIWVLYPQRNP